jgi:very-short-patch-repair endonuclease
MNQQILEVVSNRDNKLICQICKKELNNNFCLGQHLRFIHQIKRKDYFDMFFKIGNIGYCLYCGKETKFDKFIGKYSEYCHSHYSKSKEGKQKNSILQTGKKRSEEFKSQQSNRFIGIIKSKEWCTNISISRKLNPSPGMIGKKHNEETREKISKSLKGKKSWNEGIHLPQYIKDKIRVSTIKRMEIQYCNGEPLYPFIGKQERLFLDEIQKYTIYKIIRNDNSFRYIIGRFPDGHILELKLFIQFDESFHFVDRKCIIYKQDDINCTLQLASLGYIVFRVSERDWKENKEKIIEQFKQLIEELECLKKN